MKKTLLSLAIAAGVSMSGIAMAADTSAPQFGVVDYMAVFQQVPQGNATLDQMKADLKPKVDALKTQQDSIRQKMADLDRNSATMTKDAVLTQKKDLLQQQVAFEKQVAALQQDEMKKEQVAADAFNNSINSAVSKVASDQHLGLVLNSQATPYIAPGYDVTPKVVALMKDAGPKAVPAVTASK